MTTILAYAAIASIGLALCFTPLIQRRMVHLIGLAILAAGFASVISGLGCERACVCCATGTIWIGLSSITEEVHRKRIASIPSRISATD